MDPLGQPCSITDSERLPTWHSTIPPVYDLHDTDDFMKIVFHASTEINSSLSIWDGDITLLNVNCIVHVLNESGNLSNSPLFAKMDPGSHDLNWMDSLIEIKQCRTGEAKLTKGYKLPCRYVIHTVGPRYNSRYLSAAENALYNCYRNSLMVMLEKELKTIAISPVHCIRLNYPLEQGAHIALRTLRRFLERFEKSISRIVLVIPEFYKEVYTKMLPLYFPRNHDEELYSKKNLPFDIGNEHGEPIRADRVIRISKNPIKRIGAGSDSQNDSDDENVDHLTNHGDEETSIEAVEAHESLEDRDNPGLHAFGRMEQDPDTRHRARQMVQLGGAISLEQALSAQRRYERWLRRSHQADLSSISDLHCIYESGRDKYGRTVIVVIGKYFPADTIDFHKAAMYFIRLMDKVVNQPYCVVYLHTDAHKENQPPLAFIRDIYNIVDARYKQNLHSFFIIHSGFFARVFTWFFTTFSAAEVKSKVHRLNNLSQLFQFIDRHQLELPDFCYQHDKRIAPLTYRIDQAFVDKNATL